MSSAISPSAISLRLDQAVVRRGDQVVLDQASVVFDRPEVTAILGPNGAGKTTLLSALAGLLPLASGRRQMLDQAGQPAPITRLGYVLQKPVMFRRSVLDNIHMAMRAAGRAPETHHAERDQMLHLMGLDQLQHNSAYQLSQGERQRLAVARVLLMQPGLLMLDEAGNSLDQDTLTCLEREVRRTADLGLPVIWVTHSLDQARRIADRVITLDQGRITSDRSAAEAFSA